MTNPTQVAVLTGHNEDRVWHAAWSPNGHYLATCGEDKVVRIWCANGSGVNNSGSSSSSGKAEHAWASAEHIKCIATLEDAQQRTIRMCEWSPNGTMIASASFDGTIVVWECQNKPLGSSASSGMMCTKWEQVSSLEGHENEVKGVAWSPDGALIATCGRDKKIWIWECSFESDFECVALLSEHTQDVKFVTWHPSLRVLFSCSYDDSIKVWTGDDMDTTDEWRCLATLNGHTSTVWSLCIDPQLGHRMISCSDDLSIILWENNNPGDITHGQWSQLAVLNNLHNFPIYSVHWLSGGDSGCRDLVASGSADNSIALSTVERDSAGVSSLQLVYRLDSAHMNDVNCVRWRPYHGDSSCDALLASCGDDGTVRIFKLVVR